MAEPGEREGKDGEFVDDRKRDWNPAWGGGGTTESTSGQIGQLDEDEMAINNKRPQEDSS